MLKKVTVYLPEKDVRTLKRISSKCKIPVTHLVRVGVQMVCEKQNKTKLLNTADILRALSDIRKKTKYKNVSDKKIMKWAVQAQREVRREMA